TTRSASERTSRSARPTSARNSSDHHSQREVRRREQEADSRLLAVAAAGHLEGRTDPVRGDEAELAGRDGLPATGYENRVDAADRGGTAGPVGERQQRVARPAVA